MKKAMDNSMSFTEFYQKLTKCAGARIRLVNLDDDYVYHDNVIIVRDCYADEAWYWFSDDDLYEKGITPDIMEKYYEEFFESGSKVIDISITFFD
ncbi:MAG: hypothetical protein LBD41_03150 [Clostridiales Family XIII bacterium]|jgi:hypothetical protein|nr:hypothetical protein [Clostridiales Family XIII bacterium]